jgi:hypothetical protein
MDLVTHCREAIGADNIATIDETLEIYLKWATNTFTKIVTLLRNPQ